jgi:hypothetical protein
VPNRARNAVQATNYHKRKLLTPLTAVSLGNRCSIHLSYGATH